MKRKLKPLLALDTLCLGCLIYQQLLAVMGLGPALGGPELSEWSATDIPAGSR